MTTGPGGGAKIYIASSWKNEIAVKHLADFFRYKGFEVDCFADASSGRFVFHWSEIGDRESFNQKSFLDDERSKRAFLEDKKWLDWCDICILFLPAGRSSHLEAGYVKGKEKKLIILTDLVPGEFDVMYGFADLITNNLGEVIDFLNSGPGPSKAKEE